MEMTRSNRTKTAVELLILAADQGYAAAQNALAVLLQSMI
jgi:hypothetical protein